MINKPMIQIYAYKNVSLYINDIHLFIFTFHNALSILHSLYSRKKYTIHIYTQMHTEIGLNLEEGIR